ncbi:MAG: glucose 1-dehydrogenase [Acidobacteria bacterium]|nr:glucose 1-dehydrogenase [Acidobacteriota bacterium]
MKPDCLNNKVAIVTGARRGIGKTIAVTFADAGADVVVCDAMADDGKLKETEDIIRKRGRRSLAVQADISLRSDVEKMTRLAIDAFGKIDILVNCAGVWIPGQTLVECSDENWDVVIGTNLKGTFLCCREAGRQMIAQRSGCIINLSSQVGLTPAMGAGAYSTSKAGILMLTRQLAQEMAGYNIRVNALAPGIVKTDFNSDFWREPDKEKEASGMVPLGRLAETEDIAQAALFLASDASGYITGEVLCINGGWHPTSSVGSR